MEKDGPWEVHTLTIKDAILEDAGQYQLQASNRIGKKEAVSTLTVVTEPPNFPKPLNDVTTKLGSTEVFEVVVGGVPKPEVVWMKGDKELKKGKRVLFEEEEVDGGLMKYKLTIKDIDMKDFGEVMFFSHAFKWSFISTFYLSLDLPGGQEHGRRERVRLHLPDRAREAHDRVRLPEDAGGQGGWRLRAHSQGKGEF